MKKNVGTQPDRGGGGGGGRPSFKRCQKCGYHILGPYLKYHVCRINEDGTLDKWEPWGTERVKGRKAKRS